MTDNAFGSYQPPPPRFRGSAVTSRYITMRDGVRLAATITLPGNLPAGERLPVLLTQTRYWRALELKSPFSSFLTPDVLNLAHRKHKPLLLGQGYALVTVDVRGTGASFGVWQHPWDAASVADAADIVDWLAAQPWCNGSIIGAGGSYLGTTAELLPAAQRAAIKAVMPMFNHPDAYTDIALPGGIFNKRFITAWGNMDRLLDRNTVPDEVGGAFGKVIVRGVKPVDGDADRRLLRAALADHKANADVFAHAGEIVCRDDIYPGSDMSTDDMLVQRYAREIASASVAVGGWGSWMDAGTADAALRRFMTFDTAEWCVIGAWEHGCNMNADPYVAPRAAVDPSLMSQWCELLRFYDAYAKDVDNGVRGKKTLWYYTMGEQAWKSTHVWPPRGVRMQRWYMAGGHALSPEAPAGDDGADGYTVDFAASTGPQNRWWELSAAKRQTVYYPGRAEAAQHMLVYQTPPLERDCEITGYPVVTLYVTSSEADGAFYVYLEDVAPDGHVTYITDGQLRAIHRKVSSETPPYRLLVPYHTFKRRDVQPLVPGATAELAFGLLPTSALVRKGHRLRVGIAGHDEGTFARVPETGTPHITVTRNRVHASHIDLPVIERQCRNIISGGQP